VEEYLSMFDFHLSLIESMDLAPVRAPLHAWWATKSITGADQNGERWKSLTSGALFEEAVEGDHFGIMYPPSVDRLAARLSLRLGNLG
jgi:hypothetical protein